MNDPLEINGNTLISWGVPRGPHFKAALDAARSASHAGEDAARTAAFATLPPPVETLPVRAYGSVGFAVNVTPYDEEEIANIEACKAHMAEIMRIPTIVAGALMPDACPVEKTLGVIPVGGVVAAENAIHPGFHSADICCSVAISIFGTDDEAVATRALDLGMARSHFGGGGRPRGEQIRPPAEILEAFEGNSFLNPLISKAIEHFSTQGDGNHFFYVGRVRSSGRIALVTHHGSRAPGAHLYKAGMAVAQAQTKRVSPETPAHNAWIRADSDEGRAYWQALQTVRAWTKANHFAIHDLIANALGIGVEDRFWNEHNFVFERGGLYYHAKGATPAWRDFATDTNGLTLIPLNMAEPILIARGSDAPHALGFSPHGAGRNMSRTSFMKRYAGMSEQDVIREAAPGIDVRYFCGTPDLSELPTAYKHAGRIREQINEYGLAEIVDQVDPIGNIMAGDWQKDAPWRKGKRR